jgi:hypothetical protein
MIIDESPLKIEGMGSKCRKVHWFWKGSKKVLVKEKYNVRWNTLYEEFNPKVKQVIYQIFKSVIKAV